MIKQYLRSKDNRRIGLMVGININGIISIGVSAVAPTDVFNVELAHVIASGRANMYSKLPNRYKEDISIFAERCDRYFKDAKFANNVKEFLSASVVERHTR